MEKVRNPGIRDLEDGHDLTVPSRYRQCRGCPLLLQGSQGLPTALGSDFHLRSVASIYESNELPLTSRTDKTVPKPVLDILAEMIAADSGLNVGPFGSGPGSDNGMPSVGLD